MGQYHTTLATLAYDASAEWTRDALFRRPRDRQSRLSKCDTLTTGFGARAICNAVSGQLATSSGVVWSSF
jgi:hypothetical protein